MQNIDVDIYIKQLISFFDKNPDSLKELIGGIDKELFFEKVKEQCFENVRKDDEISLTQKQLLDIVAKLHNVKPIKKLPKSLAGMFELTKYGLISLN
jgi:hypothetical protein